MPSISTTKYLLVGLGTLAFAACGTDRQESPLAPTGASYAGGKAPATCSASLLSSDARNYFSNNKDTVYSLIKAVGDAYTAGATASATDAGFDVLERVSVALTETGAISGDAAAGDKLVKDVMLCMSVGTLPTGFSVAKALEPSGLFAVRGGADDPNTAAASRLAPYYGAEPSTGTWSDAAEKRFLMYGYRIPFAGFSVETPAADSAFELSTIPTPINFDPAIGAGECTADDDAGSPRFQHVGVVLAPYSLKFCDSVGLLTPEATGLFGFAKRVGSWFAPTPLYAFAVRSGGLISGLSPGGAVVFVADSVRLNFVARVPNAKVTSLTAQFNPTIQVQAKTEKGTALGGVLVKLVVAGNSGSFTPPSDSLRTTDDKGVATFSNFYLNKAGGYTITATGTILGADTKSAISNLFNVKNQ